MNCREKLDQLGAPIWPTHAQFRTSPTAGRDYSSPPPSLVELPLDFPHMAFGVNQTVVFALLMVIIGALIGTDDLGQLILKTLSERSGVGNGLILGLCVAFIGLAIDQILRTWANQRKQALGIE